MGLTDGLIRFQLVTDNRRTYEMMKACMNWIYYNPIYDKIIFLVFFPKPLKAILAGFICLIKRYF
jgi:hypothetical protein